MDGTLSVSFPQNEAPYTLFVISSPFVKENSMGSLLGTKNFQEIYVLRMRTHAMWEPKCRSQIPRAVPNKGLKLHAQCSKRIGDGPINVGPFLKKLKKIELWV